MSRAKPDPKAAAEDAGRRRVCMGGDHCPCRRFVQTPKIGPSDLGARCVCGHLRAQHVDQDAG